MTYATVPDLHASNLRRCNWHKRNEIAVTPWLFPAPAILFFLFYVIFPIFQSFSISLSDWDGLGDATV